MKIIDNAEIKLANKVRDNSLAKAISNINETEIIKTKEFDKKLNKLVVIKRKFDYLRVIRNTKGEIVLWEIYYKSV